MSNINLHNVDCEEFMSSVPDWHYDLAIVDPQYGIGEDGSRNHSRSKAFGSPSFGAKNSRKRIIPATDYVPFHGNDVAPPSTRYFNELRRVSKNQIIWGGNYFIDELRSTSCFIVWDKDNSGDFADYELAWTSFNTAVRKFKYRWNGMLQEVMGNKKEIRIHPTQKPVALYKWLLNNYGESGDKILDTHGGSMSIAIACYDLGFSLDLCELHEGYFKAGQARLDAHIAKYAPASEIPVTKKGEIKLF